MSTTVPTSRRTHTVLDSPVGPLTLVATGTALGGLYLHDQRHRPADASFGHYDPETLPDVVSQLHDYFAGRRTEFDVTVELSGTPFQRRVWQELRTVPYGQTVTYQEIAERIGRPTAARAVGLANGRNPISLVVPCHRVLGSNGSLVGYGGGIDRKRYLLDLERRTLCGGQE